MQTVMIEWQHLDVNGKTCDRCTTTQKNLEAGVSLLNLELKSRGITIEWFETKLDANQVLLSNGLRFNGIPIEEILDIAVSNNYCASCSELVNETSDCRTVNYRSKVYDEVPTVAIKDAVYTLLKLKNLNGPSIFMR